MQQLHLRVLATDLLTRRVGRIVWIDVENQPQEMHGMPQGDFGFVRAHPLPEMSLGSLEIIFIFHFLAEEPGLATDDEEASDWRVQCGEVGVDIELTVQGSSSGMAFFAEVRAEGGEFASWIAGVAGLKGGQEREDQPGPERIQGVGNGVDDRVGRRREVGLLVKCRQLGPFFHTRTLPQCIVTWKGRGREGLNWPPWKQNGLLFEKDGLLSVEQKEAE